MGSTRWVLRRARSLLAPLACPPLRAALLVGACHAHTTWDPAQLATAGATARRDALQAAPDQTCRAAASLHFAAQPPGAACRSDCPQRSTHKPPTYLLAALVCGTTCRSLLCTRGATTCWGCSARSTRRTACATCSTVRAAPASFPAAPQAAGPCPSQTFGHRPAALGRACRTCCRRARRYARVPSLSCPGQGIWAWLWRQLRSSHAACCRLPSPVARRPGPGL